MPSVAAPILLALALALALLQGGGEVPADPTHVSLPVVVRDARDRSVATLTADDFEVTDRAAPIRVVDARFITSTPTRSDSVGTAGAPGGDNGADVATTPEPGARLFALFLDEYHVAAADSARARALLEDFIRKQTTPQDWFLIVKPLDPLLTLSPTRGPSAALAAIASFEGRLGDYVPRTAFERELIAADPVRIDRARARIATSAVQAIATRLAQFGPTRKAFLIVGQEFEPLGAAGRVAESWPPLPLLDAIVRAAERGSVSISTLDPRAMPPTSTPAVPQSPPRTRVAPSRGQGVDTTDTGIAVSPPETLFAQLVRLTDGRAFRAPFEGALSSLAADLGDYYLLTLRGADDGQYHAVDIRLARPGLRARARPGYWAPSADAVARASRDAAARPAVPAFAPLRSSRLIVPWFGQERIETDRTRVTFVWDPAPTRAGERTRGLPPSRVVVTAQAADGTTLFDGTVHALSSGMRSLSAAAFEASPGRVRLQMSIQDASARELDTDVREVIVSGFAGAVGLGTPRVFRARTAREYNALADDPAAAPSASRTFGRTERLLFRVPIHTTAESAAPVVSAALVSRTGHVLRPLPILQTADASFVTTDLPLAGLAAGEYSVRWTVASGAEEARESVLFRVIP